MFKAEVACFAILISSTLSVYANGSDQEKSGTVLNSVEVLKAKQIELKSAIDSQIGDAKCSKDEDCRTLAIGANPCGGPEEYQAYSVVGTDVNRLKRLAQEYKTVRKALHLKTGAVGACIVIPEPQVQCKNHRCITAPRQGDIIY